MNSMLENHSCCHCERSEAISYFLQSASCEIASSSLPRRLRLLATTVNPSPRNDRNGVIARHNLTVLRTSPATRDSWS